MGRLLHDQTAEEIARPISQLDRVVATIVPFDVEKILSGEDLLVHEKREVLAVKPAEPKPLAKQTVAVESEPGSISHYDENIQPIANASWRKRAHVRGNVTSIRTAPSGGAPRIEVEVWDSTGGITLQFLGRREIKGLEVGSTICAEGMVGEADGALIILNPSYELVI